jgi:hypothetical protein
MTKLTDSTSGDTSLNKANGVESVSVTSEESDLDVADILQQLESAECVARGVENRLDDIIGNLDRLLAALEPSGRAEEPLPAAEEK